ncbi:MAG: MarR family transcriptional regulator [Clostridiales bacterium]|nr:MarR family transcriptional regulator [Clostridiales bacterium]
MNYEPLAQELINSLLLSEMRGSLVQKQLAELAHGELAALNYLGLQKDGASPKELSRQLMVNTSRVAAILNSLVKKGYAVRRADPDDGRMLQVFITDSGRQYAQEKRAFYLSCCTMLLEQLGEEDAASYVRIAGRIAALSDPESGVLPAPCPPQGGQKRGKKAV